ncbi:MAG: hypothetical protein ACREQY_21660 [Candidatus Binatia bacterium]
MTSKTNRILIGAWIAVLAIALTGAAARAHEGHEHEAKGTVKAVETALLTLDTTDGKVLELAVDAQTKFLRGAEAVTAADVAVGERAVVKYHQMEGKLHAMEVKLAEKKA